MSKRNKKRGGNPVEQQTIQEPGIPVGPGISRALHRSLTVTQEYQGPLPPGEEFERYERVRPGAAERILAMAEREQARRHPSIDAAIELDRKSLKHDILRSYVGQCFGLLAVTMAFALAGYCIFRGYPWAAVGIAGGTLASLASVFVAGRKYRAQTGPPTAYPAPSAPPETPRK
jgi:uncharacterized membrane protein